MGCWGVKAFESDEGLDALEWIRNHIPEDGCLRLKELLEQLKLDEWCRPPAAENGESHSSTMLIAELMESFQNGTIEEWEYLPNNPFEKVVSFLVEKESVKEMCEYLSKTLESARKNTQDNQWNGWFEETNWNKWQEHMESLIETMRKILEQVIASGIAERLCIPHTKYTLLWEHEKPFSVCQDFITSETELVSAYHIM